MAQYAANTSVSVAKSKEEIERTLARYGADGFMYGTQGNQAVVQFTAHGRLIRLSLTFPDKEDRQFTHTATGKLRKDSGAKEREWEQACRQRWRALNILVKAKLEAVESGITTFEDEWLSHTVMPNGQTVGEQIQPTIDKAIKSGQQPRLLLTTGVS